MDYSILDKYSHLPANKLKVVQIISTKGLDHALSLEGIAAECKVTRKTLLSWRSEKEFNDVLMQLVRILIDSY